MQLIDRYIFKRMMINFTLLFVLLFLFAAGIDLVVNLDEFVKRAGADGTVDGGAGRVWSMLKLMADFQFPRVFLFYAYMHGLVAIGAMGFTLAQMHRHRELVALLASGVSLNRLAIPFLAAVFLVSLLQLINQEFVLYRVAPLVLRKHGEIGKHELNAFPLRFTDDGNGNLFHSPSFDEGTETLFQLTILERDTEGRATRRITADRATWNEEDGGWDLEEGKVTELRDMRTGEVESLPWQQSLEFYPSDLDATSLTVNEYSQYAAMLSLRQIDQMLATPHLADSTSLRRFRFARFATIALNVLVLFVALPSFLLREPANLMRQSVSCASLAVPALMGGSVGMTLDMPGIAPAVGVFLPVVLMIPVAVARWTFLRS